MTKIFIKRPRFIGLYRKGMQLLIFWLMLTPLCAVADLLVGAEYEVKMGFIFNFVNFVTWPAEAFENAEDALNFCFASDHPAANVLFQLNDQSIQGRTLKVRKIESEIDTKECQILFFGTNNKTYIRQLLATIRGQNILTVGEVGGFAQMGGVINFFNLSNKLRFEVNIDAAQREDLKFSAQILQSAQRIVRETEEDRKAQAAEIAKQQKQPKATPKAEKSKPVENTPSKEIAPPESPQVKENESVETQPAKERSPAADEPVKETLPAESEPAKEIEQTNENAQPDQSGPARKVEE